MKNHRGAKSVPARNRINIQSSVFVCCLFSAMQHVGRMSGLIGSRKWRMATSYLGESVQPGAARTSLTSPVLSTPTPLSSTPAEIGISCSSSFRSRQSHQISYSDHCNKLVGLVVIIVWLIGGIKQILNLNNQF